jgi:hypothetical protein
VTEYKKPGRFTLARLQKKLDKFPPEDWKQKGHSMRLRDIRERIHAV